MADFDPTLDDSDDELARQLGLDSDEDAPKPSRTRKVAAKESDDDGEKKAKAKKARKARRKVMDDFIVDEEDSESDEEPKKKKKKTPAENAKPDFEMPEVDDVLKSIFGDSDDEKLAHFDDDEENFSDLSDIDEGVVPRTKTQVKKWATYYKKEMTAAKRGNKKGRGRGGDDDGEIEDGNVLPEGSKRRRRAAYDSDEDDRVAVPQERMKKGNGSKMSEDEIKEKSIEFVTRMEQAWAEDDAANRAKRPALKKMAMLEETKQTMYREEWHEHLLNSGVLLVATKWLSPLPDRTLPSFNIRDGVVRALASFREVSKYQLKESRVGAIIKFLSQNDPEPSLRKAAADLALQWSRTLSSASDSWASLGEVDRVRHSNSTRLSDNARRVLSTQLAFGRRVQGNDGPARKVQGPQFASQPLLSTMDYTIRPESKVDASQLVKKSGGLRIFAKN